VAVGALLLVVLLLCLRKKLVRAAARVALEACLIRTKAWDVRRRSKDEDMTRLARV
jgi:hypothetical protein